MKTNTQAPTRRLNAADLINNPSVSYWLKDAIRALNGRDLCDAMCDAETLHAYMIQRYAELTGVGGR